MKMPVSTAACVLVVAAAATVAFSTASEARSRHHHSHSSKHFHSSRHHVRAEAPAALITLPFAANKQTQFGVPQPEIQTSRQARRAGRRARVAAQAAVTNPTAFSGIGGSDVVAEARRYIGGNPTGRRSLWCGRFMNFVLDRTGHKDSGSDLARSFASYGSRLSGPQVGAIAVMSRRGGGHVGVVSGIDPKGNPIVISGNHGNRVAESVYPAGRVYAYVLPR